MFTTRYVELHEADAILVCVPTPLTRNREPDLGPLLSASRSLAGVIRRGQTIVLESTTFPGTTREHLVPLLEESGLQAGEPTSRWPSRRSASTRAARTTRCATRRRWSAA